MIYDLRKKHFFENRNKGFTLIELLVVMGLFALLAAFTTVNLIRPQTKASVDSVVTQITTDLKAQQIKSMVGDSEGQSNAQAYGIYIGNNSYTLFRGSTYSAGDTSNFEVKLDSNLNISSNFSGSQIVFNRRSGEVNNFVNGSNAITVTNSADGETKTLTINQLGAINSP